MPVINIVSPEVEKFVPQEPVDINNASEADLAALPGISIIMAKKVIKKREEIGGFKSKADFYKFLQIKKHMQKQLEAFIFINDMKQEQKIENFDERNVDL